MERRDYDLAVIGGGIAGCAVARDAAGRGLSVLLCEEGDLAGEASSATLRLAHGGLVHLARGRLSLLRQNLRERNILCRAAPYLVTPVRVLVPWHERMWPGWAVGAGLRLYDMAGRRVLPRSERLDLELNAPPAAGALQRHFEAAFAFSDCLADDARLAVVNAIDARAHGAEIATRMRCVVAEREGMQWRLSLESVRDGERFSVSARALVNATGARAADTLDHIIHTSQQVPVRTLKTVTAIVQRRIGEGAYALPNADGRVVYVTPHGEGATLIGVEGLPVRAGDDAGTAEARDLRYLCDVVAQFLRAGPGPDEVVRVETGFAVMPRSADLTRQEHAIEVDAPPQVGPLVSVFGGTLTTHRLVAEQAVDAIARALDAGPAWTADAPLPGGGMPADGVARLVGALTAAYPFLGSLHAQRLAATYGARAAGVMSGAGDAADFGAWFGGYLTERELAYLVAEEWAETAEDVLWRRTRLGLALDEARRARVAAWFDARAGAGETAASPRETAA